MPDSLNFQSLKNQISEGVDYRIRMAEGVSGILIMAPHGGRIEPGTTEIAEAVAAQQHAFYTFSGIRKQGNGLLHITSRLFDEPKALSMVRRAIAVVTIHGCRENAPMVYSGGRHLKLRRHIAYALQKSGFNVGHHPKLPGQHPANVCNRGRSGMGVQLEISNGLRREIFGDSLQVRKIQRKGVFNALVAAVRNGIEAALINGAAGRDVPRED